MHVVIGKCVVVNLYAGIVVAEIHKTRRKYVLNRRGVLEGENIVVNQGSAGPSVRVQEGRGCLPIPVEAVVIELKVGDGDG